MKETEKSHESKPYDLSGKESSVSYIVQKLEKIANAFYLITSYFPESEPLRTSLRQKALVLLESTFLLKTLSNQSMSYLDIETTLEEVISLSRLASAAGLISQANVSIIKEECDHVVSFGKEKGLVIGPHLEAQHFSVSLQIPARIETLQADAPSIARVERSHIPPLPQKTAPHASLSVEAVQKPKEEPSGLKKRRRDAILACIKQKGEVGIRDIAREVRGCSQKTIQRELVELVEEGIISKRGERRWSLYSLIGSSV